MEGDPEVSGLGRPCPLPGPPSAASAVSPGAPRSPVEGPRLETLLGRLRSLQRGRQAAARELGEARGRGEGLRRRLGQLEERRAALEGLWQQAQEALRVARLRREEVEAEGQRRRGQCQARRRQLEGEGQQRGRLRQLRRAHRLEFCRQLTDLAREHEQLRAAHAPAQLKVELVRLEEAREKLLSQERHLLEAEEHLGPEAHVALRLVEEEEEGARQRLGAELGRRQGNLRRRDRLAEELERLQRPLEAPPE